MPYSIQSPALLMIRPLHLPPEKESNNTDLYTHWCSYTSLSWHHKSCHRTQHYRLVCCSYWMSTQHHTHTSDLTAQYRNHVYHILWNTLSQNYKLNQNHDRDKETFQNYFPINKLHCTMNKLFLLSLKIGDCKLIYTFYNY